MQVYLTEGQRRQLGRKAKATGVPVAALIRRAVDRYLGGAGAEVDFDEVLRRTFGAIPDLEAPPRSEWNRDLAAEDPPAHA